MASELIIFENTLKPLAPRFEHALGGAMPVDRLMQSIIISVERTPKLLECDRQTLLNASMSAAYLGLEVDGVTGQAFFIPYGSRAQLIIGYKGMNTLAARSGFTVSGEVVRDGDAFDYELGDKGFVRHKPKLGNKAPIIAAWATASAMGRPPIISVMGIDDLMAVKAKSPGARKSDSPWNEPLVGLPAMFGKTAKRRLSRSMPLNADPRFHMAAALDEAFEERGRGAWIDPGRGLQIEGEAHETDGPRVNHDQRSTAQLLSPGNPAPVTSAAPPPTPGPGAADEQIPTAADYSAQWDGIISGATNADQLTATWNGQKDLRDRIEWPEDCSFKTLKDKVGRAINFLKVPA